MFRFPRKETENTKISLADALYFLRSSSKFFGLSALVLSVIAVALISLIPKQYGTQINLSVRQVPSELSEPQRQPLEVKVDKDTTDTLGTAAVRYIQEGDLGDVNASPVYDMPEQQVRVPLRSRDRGALDGIDSKVADLLKARFQEYFESLLGPTLEVRLSALERSLQNDKETLAQIEQQIKQSSSANATSTGNAEATTRLEGLEVQRARVLGDISSTELEIRNLRQAQSELPRYAADMVSIRVLNESDLGESDEVSQVSSPAQRIALAILVALVAAAILTIVRGAFRRGPRV